jgi:hypothetical protein
MICNRRANCGRLGYILETEKKVLDVPMARGAFGPRHADHACQQLTRIVSARSSRWGAFAASMHLAGCSSTGSLDRERGNGTLRASASP